MCASTSSPVSSTMTFIEPWDQETKGRPFFRSAAAPGMETINFKWVENEVSISNARPLRDDFGLDQNGFAYMDDEDGLDGEVLQALRCGDKEEVKRLYYPRIESLVKRATGGQRVITFDHTMRKRDPARDKRDNTDGHEQPATTVWHHALYLFPIALTQSSADQIEDRCTAISCVAYSRDAGGAAANRSSADPGRARCAVCVRNWAPKMTTTTSQQNVSK